MKSLKVFILLLSAHRQIFGEFINPCSNTTTVTPLKDFDIEKFSRIQWYDIVYIDKERIAETQVFCPRLNFTTTSDPYTHEFTIKFYMNQSDPREMQEVMQLHADPDYPALARYGPNETFTMMVVDTDYETWATLYGCFVNDEDEEPVPFADIKSSTRALEKDILDKLVSDIEKLGFTQENFYPTVQTDCDTNEM